MAVDGDVDSAFPHVSKISGAVEFRAREQEFWS
jgi:hypothetical protein